MNVLIIHIFCILVVVTSTRALVFGESCTRNEECSSTSPDYVCRPARPGASAICNCKAGQRPGSVNEDGKKECIDVLRSACSENSDCESLEGSFCEQNHCICKRGTLPEDGKCVTYDGHNCKSSEPCQAALGEKGECQSGSCVCQEKYHKTDDGCIQTKRLNDQCSRNEECFQKLGMDNVLQCDSATKCVCKEGYRESGDECSGASNFLGFSFITLILTAFLASL